MAQLDPQVLEAVGRASKRSSSVQHEDMKTGLYDLATIASIAPWFGIFGTIVGIVNSFQGVDGPRSFGLATLFKGLSAAMWFTALGLLVGLVALWSYEYLAGRLRCLDAEMENASKELLNHLGRFQGRFEVAPRTGQARDNPMFGELAFEDVQREEKYFRLCYFLTGVTLALAWFFQASRYFLDSSFYLSSALWAACFGVPITFAISCFVLYPIWSNVLHRRPGRLIALGSTLCLCWSVAEFVLGRHLP